MNIQTEISQFMERVPGVTLYRIAKKAGLPRVYLYRLVNGKQKDISSRHADAIREAMTDLMAERSEAVNA